MKKKLSILVTLVTVVSAAWAEMYNVNNFNLTDENKGDANHYVSTFTTQNAPYVSMTHSGKATMLADKYIRPSGADTNGEQTGYITLTAADGCYLYFFSAKLCSSNPDGNPVALRWNQAPTAITGFLGSFSSWDADMTNDDNSGTLAQFTQENNKSLQVHTGYFKPYIGTSNYAHLQDICATILVPEVLVDGQTAPGIYNVLEKPTNKNTEVEFSIVYDVKDCFVKEDFTASISDFTGKGNLVVNSWSYANKKLTVSCTYTTADNDDFATNYSGRLTVSSKNEIDDSSFTTIINGSAGNILTENDLAWNLPEKLYVNTTITDPTTFNSPVTIKYDSEDPDVAYFQDGKLYLKAAGTTILSASQDANEEYAASSCPDIEITVDKRTPAFTINPQGDLYTSVNYLSYITPTLGVDPNGNMNPTYSSSDELLFTVDENGNVFTNAGLGAAKLLWSVAETEEWKETSGEFDVNIVRDPIHVPVCLTGDLLVNNRFTVERVGQITSWSDGALQLGGTHSSASTSASVTFHVTGNLEALNIGSITTTGSIESIVISQKASWDGDWSVVQTLTAAASNLSYPLNVTTKYIKIEFTGVKTIFISDLCITERVGASITPNPIELVVLDDGNGGKLVSNATFTASVSNLTELTLQLDSDDFILLRDGKTYNETDNTLLLDYTDGLGIDKNASAVVTVQYVGVPANAAGKTCTVTAFDENSAEQAAATIQITEITTTDGAPNIIVAANAEQTGIYTGTEHDSDKHPKNGTFPYKTKQQVNVASAFADGQPLFDRLYIFGLTKNKSNQTTTTSGVQYHTITTPNATNPSPAITPCYIYDKEGSGYRLTQTIADMNPTSGTKPLPALTASGQKLYYTGYCPYASNGCAGEKGVILITGGAGAKVDVYLENLYLYARPHTQSGASKILTTDTLKMNMGLGDGNYVGLSASAFTFEATSSTPFAPTIHVRDSNKLEGGAGALHASLLTKSATAGVHSAPIHLMVSDANHAHNMTIDDKWPINASGTVERTNGKLDLCPTSSGRPCVELGNANSVLNFNGGQIYLKNSVPTSSNYLCTFAIGHRSYTKTVSVVSATLHGLGTDRGDGTVNFNDGTINCRELSDANMNAYGGYYRSKTSMKCPQNTYINGGTFNCDIWACSEAANLGASPQNKYNNPLVSVTYPINNTPVEPYYLATIDFDALAASLTCQDATHADLGKSLADYYRGKDKYGYSSMKANADNNVTLMLPYQFTGKEFEVEETVINWATCMPTVNATAMVEGVEQTVQYGGPTTVLNNETEHTRFLFYVDIDTYTMEAAGPDAGYMTPEMFGLGSVEVAFNDGEYRNNVENETSYEVSEAQYLATPIIGGDEWFLFCPPFDITNVYVVESYSEARLKEKVEANQDRYEAQILQAEAAVDLFFYVGYETTFNQTNANLWTIYRQWKEDGTPNKGAGAIKLTHFTGSNYDANYYLQRSSGTWGWNSETSRFVTDWEYLPNVDDKTSEGYNDYYKATHGDKEYNVVMKKGQIYSMKFPYKYYGYRDENSANWDYWTGKYLIFEGLGPQTIEGKNYHQDIKKAMTVAAGSAEIRANNTLASMEVSGMGAYYLGENQRFWPSPTDNTSKEIYPSQGFILLNKPAVSPLPQRISSIDMMTGDVTYEPGDGSENTVTGTPTIAGEREMLVYTVAGGLGVVPVVPQHVSIYNAAGQLVVSQYLTGEMQFALPAGIYLVRGEKDQVKVMVK